MRQACIDSLRDAGLADGDLLTQDLINDISQRCKDKKTQVRRSALECLAQLFEAHVARYWRRGEGAPMQIYRSIPKRLILASKLDLHTASVAQRASMQHPCVSLLFSADAGFLLCAVSVCFFFLV